MCKDVRGVSGALEAFMLLSALYTDVNKENTTLLGKFEQNIFATFATISTTAAALGLQALAVRGIKNIVGKKRPDGNGLSFPSGAAASAGYATARILSNRGEGKTFALALAGTLTTFVLQCHRVDRIDMIAGFILGAFSGVAKGALDSQIMKWIE